MGVKIIVSDTIKDIFTEFKVVSDIAWIEQHKDEISVLIYHQLSKIPDFNVGVLISKLSQLGTVKFFYINPQPKTTIKMVIAGAGGIVTTEDFYLEDEEELLELLRCSGIGGDDENSETSLVNVSVNVVKDFVQSFVRGEEKIKTPAYLAMVNNAIDQLSTITAKQELQITSMGTSAIDIFKKASDVIKAMQANKEQIEEQLKLLESNQEAVTAGPTQFNSNVVMYPTYRYMSTKPLLLIREYSPCRYLTSFVMGYEHHVHFAKNKRVKLIIAHQKGAGVAAKYDAFTSINESSASYATLYKNELIATNTPTRDILKQLFNEQAEVFIVVDRLYSNQDIVEGKVCKLNAVGGLSDIERYKLEPADTIVSVRKNPDIFTTLKTTKDYQDSIDMRYAAYEQMYESEYAKLDELLGLGE